MDDVLVLRLLVKRCVNVKNVLVIA